jgi:hypothetical protein
MPSGLSRTVFGSSALSSWKHKQATGMNLRHSVVSLIKDVLADADPEVKTIGIVTRIMPRCT